MTDYQALYHLLFNAITDALSALERENTAEATALLKIAQIHAEDEFLRSPDESPAP